MDINQSSLSQYKSNKAGITRSVANTKALTEASKTKDTPSSAVQSMKQPEIREGQLLKGQITDIRYNEVKIQLEPGEQVVTAKLSGDVPLAIGQKAQFLVTEEGIDHLVLKYIPEEAAPSDVTVQKALTASGLPMTDRNRAIVSELLNHRMPIDRQTLQTLVKLSVMNRQASPLTLVLIYKNNIPMTSANIKQFEAYQNGTHQLLNDIRSISQNISELFIGSDNNLNEINGQAGLQANQADYEPAQLTGADTAVNTSLKEIVSMNGKLIDILYPASDYSGNAKERMPLSRIIIPDELSALGAAVQKLTGNEALTSGSLSDMIRQLDKGSLSIQEAVKLITGLYPEGANLSIPQALQEMLHQLKAETGNVTLPVFEKLLNQFIQTQDNSPLLSAVLSPEQRSDLLQYLSDAPDSGNLKERIAQGTASLQETLTYIQGSLDTISRENTGKLVQAPEYSKLLEEAFLQKWTIKPEDTAEKDSVVDLFRQMKEDLDKISALANTGKAAAEIQVLQEPMKNMQENLQFMKDLGNVFTYLQLPIQFKNQEAHTDLYVLSRKKALNDKRETLSVLLHLEMKNLGSLNVHIQQNHSKQLQADFYIEDTDTGLLVRQNLPLLTEALQKKGYSVLAEVKAAYKKPDFVQDFIEQSSQDSLVKRYSFDIRT